MTIRVRDDKAPEYSWLDWSDLHCGEVYQDEDGAILLVLEGGRYVWLVESGEEGDGGIRVMPAGPMVKRVRRVDIEITVVS